MKALCSFLSLLICITFLQAADPSPKDSAALDTAIDQLFKILHMEENTNNMVVGMVDSQIRADPRIASARERIHVLLVQYVGWNSIKDDIRGVWKSHFTLEEIKQLTAFYSTPTGKKYIDLMPTVLNEGSVIVNQRMTQHTPELLKVLQEELKKSAAANPGNPSPLSTKATTIK